MKPKNLLKWISGNYEFLFFVLFTVLYFVLSAYRHISFGSNSLDLGSYTQTFWLYSNFKDPVNTVLDGRRPLGDHFEPLLMVFSLIYRLIPSPFLLFFLQSIFLASIMIPLGKLMKKYSGNQIITILFLAVTGFSFLSFNAVLFDFHPLLIIAGLAAWLLYFMETKQWKFMFIVFILMLMLKETMGLWGILLGIYLLLRKEKIGWYVMGLSIFQFVLAEKFVIPHFLGKETYHLRYAELGGSFKEIIVNILKNPTLPIEILIRKKFLLYYALTIGRFPLAVFNPLGWLLVLPNFAERFLSSEQLYWGDSFHYGIFLVPILSFVTIKGVQLLRQKFPRHGYYIVIPLLLFPLLLNLYQIANSNCSRYLQLNPKIRLRIHEYKETKKLLEIIPENASVAAQDNFVSHLANRDEIYKLVAYEKGEYVVMDPTKGIWPLNKEEYNTAYQNVKTKYDLVGKYKTIEIYKQKN